MKLNEDMELEGEELTVEFEYLARCMGCGQGREVAKLMDEYTEPYAAWPICLDCLTTIANTLRDGNWR